MEIQNVFVLCTGRCGSTTFAKAFAHATNWTAGHETRTYLTGPARLAYPPRHIEADNRLSWMLGRLDRAFGKDAFYVHLTRDPDAVARSFERRLAKKAGIISAYAGEILMGAPVRSKNIAPFDFSLDYVDTVTENIRLFLRDKPLQMDFRLETGRADTETLWNRLGLTGNLDAALAAWDTRHNASRGPAGPAGRRGTGEWSLKPQQT